GWNFKSRQARDAKKKFDAAIAEADATFSRSVSDARKVLAQNLETALREATREGNFDDVLAIRGALQVLKAQEAPSTRRAQPGLLAGIWEVTFANGVKETCQ